MAFIILTGPEDSHITPAVCWVPVNAAEAVLDTSRTNRPLCKIMSGQKDDRISVSFFISFSSTNSTDGSGGSVTGVAQEAVFF